MRIHRSKHEHHLKSEESVHEGCIAKHISLSLYLSFLNFLRCDMLNSLYTHYLMLKMFVQ